MQTQDAYNSWAKTYDTVDNKTRDLEYKAIRQVLSGCFFEKIAEIGCGTGKNTSWLADACTSLTAMDFSASMLERAKQKIGSSKVIFLQTDITKPWPVKGMDLVTCSLVLEHIENIDFIFQQAGAALVSGGTFFICELHPYKQLAGGRARFERDGEWLHLEYFIHHISDYLDTARQHGFVCDNLREWFDDDDRNQPPRLVSYLFRKV